MMTPRARLLAALAALVGLAALTLPLWEVRLPSTPRDWDFRSTLEQSRE